MTSSTTARKSGSNHKATNQGAGSVQKASEQHEATPDRVERGKAEIEQTMSDRTFAMGIKLPGDTATRDNLIWWGGLAVLAALEIVDWPVAAAIAAGTWIAEQHVKQRRQFAGVEATS